MLFYVVQKALRKNDGKKAEEGNKKRNRSDEVDREKKVSVRPVHSILEYVILCGTESLAKKRWEER